MCFPGFCFYMFISQRVLRWCNAVVEEEVNNNKDKCFSGDQSFDISFPLMMWDFYLICGKGLKITMV